MLQNKKLRQNWPCVFYHILFISDIIFSMDKLISSREFDIFCGNGIAFDYVCEHIINMAGGLEAFRGRKIAICSDREVSGYFYNKFENQFIKKGIKPTLISVDSVSSSKNIASVEKVVKTLSEFDFGPNDFLIAFGGGGILDIASFAKTLFDSSIGLVLVPTTLSAMTSGVLARRAYLNCAGHKNELSVENKPSVAILDPQFVRTGTGKVRTNGNAEVVRLALLSDISIIKGLTTNVNAEDGNAFRVFMNEVYRLWNQVELMDARLFTAGEELRISIENYFRFMNYSEGEALALSILSMVDDARREVLVKIYGLLHLPTKLDGVSSPMIMRKVKEYYDHKSLIDGELVEIVDYNQASNKWIVRSVNKQTAIKMIEERVKKICGPSHSDLIHDQLIQFTKKNEDILEKK